MLVLSRKEGEKIRIGDDIVIMLVRQDGDKVKIGIDAPPDMLILSEELQSREPTAGTRGTRVRALAG